MEREHGGAILAIDVGTTGTRAGWVDVDGQTHALEYRRLTLQAHSADTVDQDANQILSQTLDACRTVIAQARRRGVELVGVALTTQRATSVLWDVRTGEPLVPAMSWQDSRYAAELAEFAPDWDGHLRSTIGRGVGIRSPYRWAAHMIAEQPHVANAFDAGALRFGTIDSWLIWNLTGGGQHVVSATIAASTGGYVLSSHNYALEWISALGCPLSILPAIRQDRDNFGTTAIQVLGIEIPILAAAGDQLAGAIGLGALRRGQVLCLHGTGSFVDLLVGDTAPHAAALDPATTAIVAMRRGGISSFAIETYAANTGSALEWLCGDLGLFETPAEISLLASSVDGAEGISFLPALTGLRSPEVPLARASLSGLSLSSDRAHLAFAVLEGIANAVTSSAIATAAAARTPVTSVVVGGGVAASDVFLQLQADLLGVDVVRPTDFATASLRGIAFLAGSDGVLWPTLDDAVATLGPSDVFSPRIDAQERARRRANWDAVVESERLRVTHRAPETRPLRTPSLPTLV